jgi:hypothetical protein
LIEEESLGESKAFMEYKHGRSPKIKPPWGIIVLSGLSVGLAYILTQIFATYALNNPYALNFLLALYGIPGGFVVALKNKTFSALISIRYAAYSGVISVVLFMGISVIMLFAFGQIGGIDDVVSLLIMTLLLILYSCVFTFSLGAILGTFAAGVIDDRKK